MRKINDALEVGGNSFMYVLTFTNTKEIFEIISLVLSILISILIIISKLIQWFKNAKKDGKISSEEIKDGIDIISNGVDSIRDKIEDKEDKR